ncbi:MAG: FAD-dependent oxidoreductase [Ruminococcaceae bacterium]|nr:FAD-dependent oxidoreductase [Oscillospiraceae bacterium]
MKRITTDVCVLGAGAAGCGVVYKLIKNGVNTVAVDKNADFGGTMVFCGVDGWEPGVTFNGLHNVLYEGLEQIENGCHVVETVPGCNFFIKDNGFNWQNTSFEKYPWGLSVPTGKNYDDTLKRCKSLRKGDTFCRFQFDGSAMKIAINNAFMPFKENLKTFFNYNFESVKKSNDKIDSIVIKSKNDSVEISAKYFVDCTGDIVLARKCGCDYSFGNDSKEDYNEPCAKDSNDMVNGVTFVFRIKKSNDVNHVDKLPEWVKSVDLKKWKENKLKQCVSCFCQYPNGDYNINMLPTIEGNEFFKLGENAEKIGKARVLLYWEFLQKEKGLKGFELVKIFESGIRESYRLKGKYVLTENDIRRGYPNIKSEKIVALADHALDVHGNDGMCKELDKPYKIPIECSMVNEFENLFVACRGASFSHIASASVRLTRTMISFGEGVGEYLLEKIKGKRD